MHSPIAIILITTCTLFALFEYTADDYITTEGWMFSQNWDYRCDNGYTYNVQGRSIYPIFGKDGKPLGCALVVK